MSVFRIHDLTPNGSLALDLRDLLDLLAPGSVQAKWVVGPVRATDPPREWFEATGVGAAEQLEALASTGSPISGADLIALAKETHQVIWGRFTGSFPPAKENWTVIQAIDSSFYEVTSQDQVVLDRIKAHYRDVRLVSVVGAKTLK